jgi:sporulation protein YabP
MEEKIHNIIMEERKKISISAVTEVETFDENEIIMKVKGAKLSIKGKNLKVENLSVETGDAVVKGEAIDCVTYSKAESERGQEGFFGRLLK